MKDKNRFIYILDSNKKGKSNMKKEIIIDQVTDFETGGKYVAYIKDAKDGTLRYVKNDNGIYIDDWTAGLDGIKEQSEYDSSRGCATRLALLKQLIRDNRYFLKDKSIYLNVNHIKCNSTYDPMFYAKMGIKIPEHHEYDAEAETVLQEIIR